MHDHVIYVEIESLSKMNLTLSINIFLEIFSTDSIARGGLSKCHIEAFCEEVAQRRAQV